MITFQARRLESLQAILPALKLTAIINKRDLANFFPQKRYNELSHCDQASFILILDTNADFPETNHKFLSTL